MKLIEHEKIPKPISITLGFVPFVVFLTKRVELQIESGDKLEEIALIVRRHWTLDLPTARRVVALWFALGERLSLGNPESALKPKELEANSRRTYAPKKRVLKA